MAEHVRGPSLSYGMPPAKETHAARRLQHDQRRGNPRGADIDHARKMFIAILAHDLRTPIGAVMMASQFMLETGDLVEPEPIHYPYEAPYSFGRTSTGRNCSRSPTTSGARSSSTRCRGCSNGSASLRRARSRRRARTTRRGFTIARWLRSDACSRGIDARRSVAPPRHRLRRSRVRDLRALLLVGGHQRVAGAGAAPHRGPAMTTTHHRSSRRPNRCTVPEG